MNCGYIFQDAVKKTLGLFTNVQDYQTIEDACARRFAGNVDTFIRWYQTGEILDRLAGEFGLTSHDWGPVGDFRCGLNLLTGANAMNDLDYDTFLKLKI